MSLDAVYPAEMIREGSERIYACSKRRCISAAGRGFIFEVQQMVAKNLGGRLIAEAFARGIIIHLDQARKLLVRERHHVGLAGQGAAQAPNGVFDIALLPRRVGITEEDVEAKGMEVIVAGKLHAVIESDGLAPRRGQGSQQRGHGLGDRGGFAGRPISRRREWRSCRVRRAWPSVRKSIRSASQWAGRPAIGGGGWPLGQRAALGDTERGAAAFPPPAPAFRFGLRQIVPPRILLFANELRIEEAVAGLVGEDGPVLFPGDPAGHLLGRPAALEVRQDGGAERGVAVELGALPAPGAGPGGRHSRGGSPGWPTHCGSVPEPRSMARGPELPQFGGSSIPWHVTRPFDSGLQG